MQMILQSSIVDNNQAQKMLPKRKFIKKRHRKPIEDETSFTQPTSLIQKLHSNDSTYIEEALVYISSMCVVEDSPQLLGLVVELIGILQKGSTSLVYQCLYALGNLVDLQPRLVPKLFEFGLDKALTQLNSGDAQLLKPILAMMTSLHGLLPQQFSFLQKGVQQSLNASHLNTNAKEQVLTYLVRIESATLGQAMYQRILQLFKNQHQLQIRALSASILMKNVSVRAKVQAELVDFCEEILCDIDLEKEYKTNIVQAKPIEKMKEVQTELMEQEQQAVPTCHPNLETFTDAVQAVQTVMESLLCLFEEMDEQQIEEQDIEAQGQWEKYKGMEAEEEFSQIFVNFVKERLIFVTRNTLLTFSQGQNIIHLALRILASLNLIDKENLSITVLKSIQNMLEVKPPQQLQQEILVVGLHILMNCPLPHNARNMMLSLGENTLKVSGSYKHCWIRLLQIYSNLFNPEKCAVSVEENRRVGAILKNLVVNIPQLTLEEWRAQTIDTIFDVFSNQNFDQYLVELGILKLLEQVLSHVGGGKKKKFVREVVSDIQRFLEYKHKMIKM